MSFVCTLAPQPNMSVHHSMRYSSLISCLILGAVLASTPAWATHIVGGELTYECLGNNQYRITLNVYRDCFNGVPPFDDPANVGIFDTQFNLVDSLQLTWNGFDDTLDIYLNNPCLVRPPNVCVHRTFYTGIVTLPPIPGGYQVAYQRCCRNELIRNIPLPEDVGITIIAEIGNEALAQCNQGAFFNNWPPLAICVNEPIDFDHSATDPDSDSLVYRLCTPLSGATDFAPMPTPTDFTPFVEVVWQNPYSLADLLGGDPVKIDPQTGFITGVPNTIGNFVVGVCVDEYRNNSIISTTRRDFQYNVADCGRAEAAFFTPTLLCDKSTPAIVNNSDINALTEAQWFFDWPNPTPGSTDLNPVYTYPDTGRYQIALILNPNNTCRDTLIRDVWVTETSAAADLNATYIGCDPTDGVIIQLNDLSTDPQHGISGRQWRLTGTGTLFTSTAASPQFTVNQAGTYNVRLISIGGNGCRDTLVESVVVTNPPNLMLDQHLNICIGEDVNLFADAPAGFNYQWSDNVGSTQVQIANPNVSPTDSVSYQLTITDPNSGCTYTGQVKVSVVDEGDLAASATPDRIFAGASSQLEATFPGGGLFNWTPVASLSNASIPNPVATPTVTTTYTVSVNTNSGCVITRTVTVVVINPLCEEPYLFFPTGFSPNGDDENDVLRMESTYTAEVYWVIYNRFGQKLFEANDIKDSWDGTFNGQDQPAETYGYYYRVRCLGGEIREQKGNVTLFR
jgi:gliding motility-associated-like protein